MVTQRDQKKRVVWQDIRPVQTRPKLPPKKPSISQVIKLKLSLLPNSVFYKKLKLKISKLPQRTAIILLATTIMTTIFIVIFITTPSRTADISSQPTDSKPVLEHGTPKYSTITPTNKKIADLGGWTRVSPPSSDPVFAYVDKIGNISINVSEQPLPNDLKNDTESKIEKLAQGFNASEKIKISDTTVHIGTSANGPQSVIFSKNNLLILIKSDSLISSNQWAEYINSLK